MACSADESEPSDPFAGLELAGPSGKADHASNVAIGDCGEVAEVRAGGALGYGIVWFRGQAGREVALEIATEAPMPVALFAPGAFGYSMQSYEPACDGGPCLEARLESDGYHAWVLLPVQETDVSVTTVCGPDCGLTLNVQPLQRPVAGQPLDLMVQLQDACVSGGELAAITEYEIYLAGQDLSSLVQEAADGPNIFRHEQGFGVVLRGLELEAGLAAVEASVRLANGQNARFSSEVEVASAAAELRAEYFFSEPDSVGRPLPPRTEPGRLVRVLVSGFEPEQARQQVAVHWIRDENQMQAEAWVDEELSERVGERSVVVAFQVPDVAPGHGHVVVQVQDRYTALHAFEVADPARVDERELVSEIAVKRLIAEPELFGNAFVLLGAHAPLAAGTVLYDGLTEEAVRELDSETWLRWVFEPAGVTEQPTGVWLLIDAESGSSEVLQREGWPKVVAPAGAAVSVDLGQVDTRSDLLFYQGNGPVPPGYIPGTEGWQPAPEYDPNWKPPVIVVPPTPAPSEPGKGTDAPFSRTVNPECEPRLLYKIGVVVQMDDQAASVTLEGKIIKTHDIFDLKARRMVEVLKAAGFHQVFHLRPPQLRAPFTRVSDGLHVASLGTYRNLFRWIDQHPYLLQNCVELFVMPIAHGTRQMQRTAKLKVGPEARAFVKTSAYGWLKFAERKQSKLGREPNLSLDYLSSLSMVDAMYQALGKSFLGRISFLTNACHAGAAKVSVKKWESDRKDFPLRWAGSSRADEVTMMGVGAVGAAGPLSLDMFFIEALDSCKKGTMDQRWSCIRSTVNAQAKKAGKSGQHPVRDD